MCLLWAGILLLIRSDFCRSDPIRSDPDFVNGPNDLVFEKIREVFLFKQKKLKKQGKGNKPKAPVALTNTLHFGLLWKT